MVDRDAPAKTSGRFQRAVRPALRPGCRRAVRRPGLGLRVPWRGARPGSARLRQLRLAGRRRERLVRRGRPRHQPVLGGRRQRHRPARRPPTPGRAGLRARPVPLRQRPRHPRLGLRRLAGGRRPGRDRGALQDPLRPLQRRARCRRGARAGLPAAEHLRAAHPRLLHLQRRREGLRPGRDARRRQLRVRAARRAQVLQHHGRLRDLPERARPGRAHRLHDHRPERRRHAAVEHAVVRAGAARQPARPARLPRRRRVAVDRPHQPHPGRGLLAGRALGPARTALGHAGGRVPAHPRPRPRSSSSRSVSAPT